MLVTVKALLPCLILVGGASLKPDFVKIVNARSIKTV